jgi:hypothetical protein
LREFLQDDERPFEAHIVVIDGHRIQDQTHIRLAQLGRNFGKLHLKRQSLYLLG